MKTSISFSQCPGGYTQAQVNWDNLDYYYNSGGSAPYASYVTSAMEQTQRFAIGTNWLTIATSATALVTTTENATHTGEIAGYTGMDVQYNPSVNNQTITLTFNSEVRNVQFTLYDVDLSQQINFGALNALGVAQTINVVTYTSSILTINNNNATNANIRASATSLATSSNQGSATITVAGPVKTITLTIATIGTDQVFWLSDINACVAGSFPINWHQGFSNRPFVGPTQNQPDYFIVTPDNKSVYMMDPASGKCYFLFSEVASAPYVNSFGYDPANKYLYYVTDGTGTPSSNKALKRYNFNTETIQTVLADVTTLGFPTYDQGVESAAAAFYDGKLYLGIEGGRSGSGGSTVTRETIVWCINLDASQNPVSAYQVFATDAYKNATDSAMHDWADIIIKDGELYSFNTARMGSGPYTYNRSAYHHYNMMTGNLDAYYQNPNYGSTFTGQSGLTWQGQLYFVRDSVGLYNENGTNSSTRYKSVVQNVPGDPVPPAWAGGAGDASDPFRPKCDFGDAPATYDPYSDPATQSPAVHERSELIRLGATWDKEFWKRGTTGTNDTDDGIASVTFLPPGWSFSYVVQVSAFNNSGANATLIAWLDYNGNGVFDASEAITPITVPSSATAQNIWLNWPSVTNTFTLGQSTYLRVRITAQSAGMTASHPTGYFTNGEVEDYRVMVDNFPLATQLLNFDALVQGRAVKLLWNMAEEPGTFAYVVERSKDNNLWESVDTILSHNSSGTYSYETYDLNPKKGNSYYRLRIIESNGTGRLSQVKRVTVKDFSDEITLLPNPAKDKITVQLNTDNITSGEISLLNMNGQTVIKSVQKFNAGVNNITINLPSSISNGSYVVKIIVGAEVVYKKAIIHK